MKSSCTRKSIKACKYNEVNPSTVCVYNCIQTAIPLIVFYLYIISISLYLDLEVITISLQINLYKSHSHIHLSDSPLKRKFKYERTHYISFIEYYQ